MGVWGFVRDPANAAAMQALSAIAVVVLTGFIVWLMARQTGILDRQAKLQEQQTQVQGRQAELNERQAQIQSMLTSLEYAPIIAAEFAGDYDSSANRILLKNGGRGPAHNIRGHLWVRTALQQWDPLEVKAHPVNLNAGDSGEVLVELERVGKLRPAFEGVEPRANDRWVLHYGDMLGHTWHTTCNIDDQGRYLPLRYFRSWSPAHWSALPEDTRKLCRICSEDQDLKAAADRAHQELSGPAPVTRREQQ
jgi:hypothetical protein